MRSGGASLRRCVFFSNITKEKGVNIILETAQKCPSISFTFYGGIVAGYEGEFLGAVSKSANVEYKGVFIGTDDEKYIELSKYNIVLLPTRWEAEGIPGIIVESRIAGLIPIISDHNYNKEIVEDGVDGILLKGKTDPIELGSSIIRLCVNRKLYDRLRRNSLIRAKEYYIENHVDRIVEELKE